MKIVFLVPDEYPVILTFWSFLSHDIGGIPELLED